MWHRLRADTTVRKPIERVADGNGVLRRDRSGRRCGSLARRRVGRGDLADGSCLYVGRGNIFSASVWGRLVDWSSGRRVACALSLAGIEIGARTSAVTPK